MMTRAIVQVAAIAVLAAAALFGQASISGSIQGTVTDSSGAPVPGAQVTARSQASGTVRQARSDDAGRYVLAGLPVGMWSLTIGGEGFSTAAFKDVQVSLGQTTVQRAALAPAMLKQSVDVTATPEALQPSASTAGVALGGERVEEAPAQNRNYLNFILNAPSIASSSGANTSRSAAGTRNVANDSGFVFAGMRGRNNSISIDGVDNRDETTGGNRVALGIEMVEEFRVSANTVAAEFGGAAGAIVNVVTRSGVNLWHGDFTFFGQNEAANARNAEVTEGPKGRYRRYQPGTSAYGPLRRDRTFLSALFEYTQESSQEFSDVPGAAAGAINAALAGPAFARAAQRSVSRGLFPTGETDHESFLKLDHRLESGHSFTARYAFSRGRVDHDVQGVDNFADRSARGSSLLRDDSFVAGWTAVGGHSLLNDLRLQLARRRGSFTPNAEGPMYEIPGVVTFGQAYRLDAARTERQAEIVDSVHWSSPRHLVSAGVDVHTVGLSSRLANRFHGIWVFPSLRDFVAGSPDVFVQAFGNAVTEMRTWPIGVWVQDRWQPRAGITVDAGVRYDRQWMPAGIPASDRNVSPRLGVAWHPAAASAWVLRAGGGVFYDRYPLAYLNDAVQKDGAHASEQYLSGPAAVAAFRFASGGALAAPFEGTAQSTYTASSDFPTTYSAKLIAGAERRIDRDTTLTFEYTALRALHLPRIRNAALTLPPQYVLEQAATSSYQGASVSLHRRLTRDISYLAAYNLGRARDNASDYDEQPSDPRNVRRDWGPSRQDQRHRFTFSGLFDTPDDFLKGLPGWLKESLDDISWAPIFTAGSGRPVNTLAATDVLRTGAYPITARPDGVGRNTGLSPANVSLDMRVMKTIRFQHDRSRLQFGVESFNILNHTNVLRVSPYVGASWGRATEVSPPRQVQVMMQFEY